MLLVRTNGTIPEEQQSYFYPAEAILLKFLTLSTIQVRQQPIGNLQVEEHVFIGQWNIFDTMLRENIVEQYDITNCTIPIVLQKAVIDWLLPVCSAVAFTFISYTAIIYL